MSGIASEEAGRVRTVLLAAVAAALMVTAVIRLLPVSARPVQDLPLSDAARDRSESDMRSVLSRGSQEPAGIQNPPDVEQVPVETASENADSPVTAVDSGWDELLRNSMSLRGLAMRVELESGFDAVQLLYRNEWLNESDRYLDPAARRELAACMRPVIAQIHAYGPVRQQFVDEQVRANVAAGRVPPLDRSRPPTDEQIRLLVEGTRASLESARALQAMGRDMGDQISKLEDKLAHPERYAGNVFVARRGVAHLHDTTGSYEIDMRRVPGWDGLEDLGLHLHETFILTAVDWFERKGCVSSSRREQIQRRILDPLREEDMSHEHR